MKRPSFQFYPGDWQANSNLRRCTRIEKSVWLDVLCLMHDQEEYGVLRWTLKEIAEAAHCKVSELKSLHEKGVLKGADKGQTCAAYIYRPRSGRREGAPVDLVPEQPGPIWYSSRFVRDEYVRTIRGESSRFGDSGDDAPNPPLGDASKHSPKPPLGDGSTASSSSSASPTTSPPIGGDAVASQPAELPPGLTAEEAVFQIAVPWLVERGVPDRNARSLMGAARKQLGDDSAWELARQFMRDKPVEPAAWISAAINARMKPGGAGRPNRQEDLEARNRAVAARLAQE
jgi:hypothetical protein